MIDTNMLIKICNTSIEQLMKDIATKYAVSLGKVHMTPDGIYVDRDSLILGVAHLDTVSFVQHHKPVLTHVGISDWQLTTIQLDDRLGVYILLDVLPKSGIVTDLLFTLDEEIGQSTAMLFDTKKKYNWIYEFDRRGYGTVVMYQYETRKHTDRLEKLGYDVQIGSFSDICSLDHLGCTGFNFGTGYIDEHSSKCRTRKSWINVSVNMFFDFYAKYKNTMFTYKKEPLQYSTYYTTGKGSWKAKRASSKDVVEVVCTSCGIELFPDEEGLCNYCYSYGGKERFVTASDGVVRKVLSLEEIRELEDTHAPNLDFHCALCDGLFNIDDLDDRKYCIDCQDYADDGILYGGG